MQKFVAKYCLAAHLAVLAVAPLFLLPFVGQEAVGTVLLWLTIPAAGWILLEPSVRQGEHLTEARRRLARGVVKDPLLWMFVAAILMVGFRALNTGIGLGYNSETAAWFLVSPPFPLMPGSVGTAGYLPFCATVAATVVVIGCRHALGLSARMAFLLIASALAGLSGVIVHLAVFYGHAPSVAFLKTANASCSFLGFGHGLWLLGGTIALVAAFERGWNVAMLLLALSIGGNAAGLFSFAPPYVVAGVLALELVLLAYSFFYSCRALRAAGEFKLLVVCGISYVLGGLLVAAILPQADLDARLTAFMTQEFFPANFWKTRAVMSAVAFKAWVSHLWIGTGLDSFSLDFRFNARPEDWNLVRAGVKAMNNGWWLLLAERGLVGMVFFVLPFCFLVFTYVRRLIRGVSLNRLPHPACLLAPFVLAAFVAVGFVDCSQLRTEVLIATASAVAVSAAAFPRRMREGHG